LAAGPVHLFAEHLEHIGHIIILSLTVDRPRLATTAHRRPCAGRTGPGLCSRPCLPGYCEVASTGRTHGDRTTRHEKAPPQGRGRTINDANQDARSASCSACDPWP